MGSGVDLGEKGRSSWSDKGPSDLLKMEESEVSHIKLCFRWINWEVKELAGEEI